METNGNSIKRTVLAVASVGSFFVPFMGASSTVALPAIAKQFSASGLMLSWIATAFILASAMFLLPFSRAADIYGRKKVFSWGLTLFTIATVICGLSISIQMLIAARFLQGVSAAMIFGTGMSLVTSVFPPGERGKALGIVSASVYTGLFLGPSLGGFLTSTLGWQSVFFLAAAISAILVVCIRFFLKGEWTQGSKEKFDVIGSVMYSIALVCLMYGCSVLPKSFGFVAIVVGVLGLTCFWLFETMIAFPIFNTRLFAQNRVFAFSNITSLFNYSATFAVTFLISLYLQYIKGFGPTHAGMVLLASPLVQALFSPFAGKMSDKFEPRIIASGGMAFCCIGLITLIFLTPQSSVVSTVLRLLLIGAGFAFFASPNTNAAMSSVDKKDYGVASGTVGTMRIFGQMVSMVIITTVLALHIGTAKILPQNYPQFLASMKMAFAIFATLCFIGIFTSLARGRTLPVGGKTLEVGS